MKEVLQSGHLDIISLVLFPLSLCYVQSFVKMGKQE